MKTNADIYRMPSISSGQAARIVGVSVDALETLTARGVLEPERTATGRLLYRPLDIVLAEQHFAAKRRRA